MPSAKAPSSSAGAIATDFRKPSTSVNHSRTKRMSRSSIVRSTNSCWRSMVIERTARRLRRGVGAPDRAAWPDGPLGWRRASVARRAGPGQRHRRRPGRATRTPSSSVTEAAAARGAHLVALPRAGADRLPARGPGAAPLVRRRLARRARARSATGSRTGLGDGRRRRRLPRPLPRRRRRGSAARPASRRTPPRCCTAARSSSRYAKHHLPNYGVFDEFRYFVPGDTLPVVRLHGVDIALTICEDLWQDGGPIAVARAGRGRAGALHQRLAVRTQQGRHPAASSTPSARPRPAPPLAYVNLVGGQDELVFDGDSMVVSDGRRAARPAAAVPRPTCWSSTSTCRPPPRAGRATSTPLDGTQMTVVRRH